MILDADPNPVAAGAAGLHAVLAHLRSVGYAFVTPTPATHRRVVGRVNKSRARNLRDVFGWSLPFDPDLLHPDLLAALRTADAVANTEDGLRAKVRVSSLDDQLFLHSAFPPKDADAVFFGPDTYRFARFLKAACDGREIGLAVDVGVGSGAGAAVIGRHYRPRRLVGADVNPAALRLAEINLAAGG